MFSNAYKIVSKFTLPVIVSTRYFDERVESGLATFIMLNDQGWVLTAAHVINPLHTLAIHQKEIVDYNAKIESIQSNAQWDAKQKRKKIGKLSKNNNWITNVSHWWGADNIRISSFVGLPMADFAIGKINNFKPEPTQTYPKFRPTTDDLLGASLCKLGFPFYNITATWDSSLHSFKIPPEIFPVPRFPIDGMGTRFLISELPNKEKLKFIETSTPGLRGQSGGPIFDIDGNICAIQIRTNHYPLGFNPEVEINKKKVVESQFLNVGVGITCETILSFLKKQNVSVHVV